MSIPRSHRQMPGTCIYVYECIRVFIYHCLIVEGRRRCLRGPALSGPSGPDRASTARWPSLAWPCPVRSGPSGPLQCLGPRTPGPDGPDRTGRDPGSPHLCVFCLFEKRWSGAPKQAFGPKVVECCSKTSFWAKSDGGLLQNKLLDQK